MISKSNAAARANVTRQTIYNLIDAGTLVVHKGGMVDAAQVDAWMATRPVARPHHITARISDETKTWLDANGANYSDAIELAVKLAREAEAKGSGSKKKAPAEGGGQD